MILIPDNRGVPINYSAEDAEKDVKTLKDILKREHLGVGLEN